MKFGSKLKRGMERESTINSLHLKKITVNILK